MSISAYILEDEKWIRLGIKKMIHWDELGLTLIGESDNGKSGIEEVERLKPDLIISDIRMPHITGLELAEHILKIYSPKIILISGYKEFEYAQKAIELKVISYLLKPVKEEELNKVIQESIVEIKKLKSVENQDDNYMLSILEERHEEVWENFDAAKKYYQVLIIPINSSLEKGRYTEINDLLEKHLEKGFHATFLKKNKREHIIIFSSLSENKLKLSTQLFFNKVEKSLQSDFFDTKWSLGSIVDDVSSIPQSYNDAWNLFASRCFGERIEGVVISETKAISTKSMDQINSEYGKILYLLETGNQEQLDQVCSEFLEKLLKESNLGRKEILVNVFFLCKEITQLLQKKGIGTDRYYEKCYELLEDEACFMSAKQISEWLLIFVKDTVKDIRISNEKGINLAINQVVEYLDKNYMRKIKLQDVADMVYLNPNYLSGMFTKVVGDSLVNYITGKRMDAAKRLLKETNLSITEIGLTIGYENTKYFLRIFRKQIGMTPSEYRKQ